MKPELALSGIAIILSVVNFVRLFLLDSTRIKVISETLKKDAAPSDFSKRLEAVKTDVLHVTVVNNSAFPINVAEIGFACGNDSIPAIWIELPKKIEPRDSFSFTYLGIEQCDKAVWTASHIYVKTSTGKVRKACGDAFRLWKETGKALGKAPHYLIQTGCSIRYTPPSNARDAATKF